MTPVGKFTLKGPAGVFCNVESTGDKMVEANPNGEDSLPRRREEACSMSCTRRKASTVCFFISKTLDSQCV